MPETPATLLAGVRGALDAAARSDTGASAIRRPFVLGALLVAGAAAAATFIAIRTADRPVEATVATDAPTVDEAPAVPSPTTVPTAPAAEQARADRPASTETDEEPGPGTARGPGQASGIALDLASVAVLPVPSDLEPDWAVDDAETFRDDIVRRIEAAGRLNVIDSDLVRRYAEAGLTDLEIGRAVGAGTVLFMIADQRGSGFRFDMFELDPETDMVFGVATVTYDGPGDVPDSVERQVYEDNADNLVRLLLEKAYPNLVAPKQRQIADLQAAVLDASLADAERTDALLELRRLDGQLPDQQTRTPAMLSAAIAMARGSDDPDVRRRVWAQLGDVDDPSVIQPLIDALAYDPSAIVRSTAATVLREYADDDDVGTALEAAATNDGDAAVREAASASRLDEGARLRLARRTFLDRDLPAQQRVDALAGAFGGISAGMAIDPDVADELFAIAVDPSPTEAVSTAWMLLIFARELDPKLVDPLLSILDGDSGMRGPAAAVLGHFRELPDVRDALERALDDPDRQVRDNAQRALECAFCPPVAQ